MKEGQVVTMFPSTYPPLFHCSWEGKSRSWIWAWNTVCLPILWTKALYWQALVFMYVGVYSKTICTCVQDTWRVGVAACRYKWGRGCNVKVWFPESTLFGGKNTLRKRFGTKDSGSLFGVWR